ncbi:hypothetical protein BDW22DRAFT_1362863 [Trametopsis cervina]|nr:hypothetical protein BDW22DRAFT_1362863 [Trametopsis cervina]
MPTVQWKVFVPIGWECVGPSEQWGHVLARVAFSRDGRKGIIFLFSCIVISITLGQCSSASSYIPINGDIKNVGVHHTRDCSLSMQADDSGGTILVSIYQGIPAPPPSS